MFSKLHFASFTRIVVIHGINSIMMILQMHVLLDSNIYSASIKHGSTFHAFDILSILQHGMLSFQKIESDPFIYTRLFR